MEEIISENEINQIEVKKKNASRIIVLSDSEKNLFAFWVRLICGCGLTKDFKPIFVMENIIPTFDKTFNYRIIEKSEWEWSVYKVALYNPIHNEIIIRSDVYDNAFNGDSLSIINITHEIMHFFQNAITRFFKKINIVEIKTEICFEDSIELIHHENQTDDITYLVLLPYCLVDGMSDEDIMDVYFIRPLIQFVASFVSKFGKELLKYLLEEKEVSKCAV